MDLKSLFNQILTYLGIYSSIKPTVYPVVNPVTDGPFISEVNGPVMPLFNSNANSINYINESVEDLIRQWSENCGLPINKTRMLSTRIIGGSDTEIGDNPWQVSLQRRSGFRQFGHFCGGSLIHPKWVLTAAHCLEWTSSVGNAELMDKMRVIVGTQTITPSTNSSVLRVNYVVINPYYESRRGLNDIALVSIENPIKLIKPNNSSVNSVCLPTKDQVLSNKLTTTGWGTTRENGFNSVQLKSVDLPLVSPKYCRRMYGRGYVSELMICAGSEGKDSCQGDSGGGLIQRDSTGRATIVGVVSVGNGCGRKGYPGIYTKVSHYMDWIHNVIKY